MHLQLPMAFWSAGFRVALHLMLEGLSWHLPYLYVSLLFSRSRYVCSVSVVNKNILSNMHTVSLSGYVEISMTYRLSATEGQTRR
jgi:hypothetical protein